MKIIITDNYKDYDISIMIDNPWSECYLAINHIPTDTTLINDTFKNVLFLSANLRDNIGLGYAMDILEKHNISKKHPIWDLNHSGLWDNTG